MADKVLVRLKFLHRAGNGWLRFGAQKA